MKFPAFVGGSYESRSRTASGERTINWYVEKMENENPKARVVFYPTPGLRRLISVAEGPIRGIWSEDDRCFFVAGPVLYELTFVEGVLATVNRGNLAVDSSPATICSNGVGAQLFVTSGGHGYILDLGTNVLTEVLDGVTAVATMGAFSDGFFLALDATNSLLRLSALFQGLSWDASRIATRTAGSDKWQAMGIAHRLVWLFGGDSTEVWYNAGTPNFEFAPIPDAYQSHGIGAGFSIAQLDEDSLIWVSKSKNASPRVFMANGLSPQRISTHALELALDTYDKAGQLSSARVFAHEHQGHPFYVINVPLADATWMYDASTQLWTEWLGWDPTNGAYTAHRAACHTRAFGFSLVGDRATGVLYDLADDAYDDDGATIRRLRRCPHFNKEKKNLFYSEFEIDCQPGVGSPDTVAHPQIMMRFSDDGGFTWAPERWSSAGRVGHYLHRAEWNMLGSSRDRVFEIAVSDAVPWALVDAYLEVQVGTH